MRNIRCRILAASASLALCGISAAAAPAPEQQASQQPVIKADGSIDIPAFTLPYSNFASVESKNRLIELQALLLAVEEASRGDVATFRKVTDEKLMLPLVAKQNARYKVDSQPEMIGGVYTEVFTPRGGESEWNRNRVLINLHGGAFVIGARTAGRIESIPIADVLKIRVISVDYRMAPEYTFPAASEDVAAVYKQVLKQYRPENVGIYGCSAGGILTGEVIAWLQKEKLPRPGAIGIFCASTNGAFDGDSMQLAARLTASGKPPPPKPERLGGPYFKGASASDPLAVPSASSEVLEQFPPTLFITGTRSPEMSSAIQSQIELTLLGVEARISIWDGMTHGFFWDPDLPESRQAYKIISDFFNDHLGKRHSER